jgi:hypothetical protein
MEKLPTYDVYTQDIMYMDMDSRVADVWRMNGVVHRDGDQPAIITEDGDMYWYSHGLRLDDGDQPAIILRNGKKYWYFHGNCHRDGDQPAIIDSRRVIFASNGLIHRETRDSNGLLLPAVIEEGYTECYLNNIVVNREGDPLKLI